MREDINSFLYTKQHGWVRLRDALTADDVAGTLLGVATRNFANRNRGAVDAVRLVSKSLNAIMITFVGAPTNHTAAFLWKLYGYRGDNGPAQNIANGTGNLGDVALTVHPITGVAATTTFYADELTVSESVWPKAVKIADIGGDTGEIATIQFDALGIKYLRCELTNVGGSNEPSSLEAIMTGF